MLDFYFLFMASVRLFLVIYTIDL